MVTPLFAFLDVATRPHIEGKQNQGRKKPRWLTSRRQRGESGNPSMDQTAIALLLDEETNFRFRLAGAMPARTPRSESLARISKFVINRTGVI
jgi:hypothetical protein